MDCRVRAGFVIAAAAMAVVSGGCGSSGSKPDPGFTGRGMVIATASGVNAYMRSFQNCVVTTDRGTVQENSAVTVTVKGKIVGSGTLSAPSFKQSTLGGSCSFSFSVPISETDDGADYPYSVRLADNSEWPATLTQLRDDGLNIGISDKSFDN